MRDGWQEPVCVWPASVVGRHGLVDRRRGRCFMSPDIAASLPFPPSVLV
jgi:hypothetical protein